MRAASTAAAASSGPSRRAPRPGAGATADAIVVSLAIIRSLTRLPLAVLAVFLLLVLLFVVFSLLLFLLLGRFVESGAGALPDLRGRQAGHAVALVGGDAARRGLLEGKPAAGPRVVDLQLAPVVVVGGKHVEGGEVRVDTVGRDRDQAGLGGRQEDVRRIGQAGPLADQLGAAVHVLVDVGPRIRVLGDEAVDG